MATPADTTAAITLAAVPVQALVSVTEIAATTIIVRKTNVTRCNLFVGRHTALTLMSLSLSHPTKTTAMLRQHPYPRQVLICQV